MLSPWLGIAHGYLVLDLKAGTDPKGGNRGFQETVLLTAGWQELSWMKI